MDADIIQVVDAVSTAKDVEREVIFDAIDICRLVPAFE